MKSTTKHNNTTSKRNSDYAPSKAQKMARVQKRMKIDRARMNDAMNSMMFARF